MLTFKRLNYFLFAGLLILNVTQFFTHVSGWWYLGHGLIYITFISIGSSRVNSQFHFKVICKGIAKQGIVLTFDDGPDPVVTPALLDLLKKHEVHAAFFLIGKKAEKYPEIVLRMYNEGHTLGNHTYSHGYFFDLYAPWIMVRELLQCDEAIFNIIGKDTHWFRPPYGVTNPMITRALKMTGHQAVGWSVRSLDTIIRNPEKLMKRITNAGNGDIILMHDIHLDTLAVLDTFISDVKKKGLAFSEPTEEIQEAAYLN